MGSDTWIQFGLHAFSIAGPILTAIIMAAFATIRRLRSDMMRGHARLDAHLSGQLQEIRDELQRVNGSVRELRQWREDHMALHERTDEFTDLRLKKLADEIGLIHKRCWQMVVGGKGHPPVPIDESGTE